MISLGKERHAARQLASCIADWLVKRSIDAHEGAWNAGFGEASRAGVRMEAHDVQGYHDGAMAITVRSIRAIGDEVPPAAHYTETGLGTQGSAAGCK